MGYGGVLDMAAFEISAAVYSAEILVLRSNYGCQDEEVIQTVVRFAESSSSYSSKIPSTGVAEGTLSQS